MSLKTEKRIYCMLLLVSPHIPNGIWNIYLFIALALCYKMSPSLLLRFFTYRTQFVSYFCLALVSILSYYYFLTLLYMSKNYIQLSLHYQNRSKIVASGVICWTYVTHTLKVISYYYYIIKRVNMIQFYYYCETVSNWNDTTAWTGNFKGK